MAVVRRATRHDALSRILSRCAAGYIRLVWITGRWRVESSERVSEMLENGEPLIGCFWHGRMLMVPNLWRGRRMKMNILISQHRDGVFISRTLSALGIHTISGSTSRGGGAGLLGIVRALKRGECVGITPDGPRGPLMSVAPGAAVAAGMSGAPLVPVTYGARWRIVASSWDRFVIPLPFTRGIIRIGDPIGVPRDADKATLADFNARLEDELVRLTNEVDETLGVDPVRPPPQPEVSEKDRAVKEGAE